MTKKFLALTMVLTLAVGFAAMAADDGSEDRALTGSWENTLTLSPNTTTNVYWYYVANSSGSDYYQKDSSDSSVITSSGLVPAVGDVSSVVSGVSDTETYYNSSPLTFGNFAAFDSKLTVDYTAGGITYGSVSEFSLGGFEDQEFSADYSVGLLDLTSTLNLNPDGGTSDPLDYLENTGSLTLGGVELGLTHLLQRVDWNGSLPNYKSSFWEEVSYSDTPTLPNWALTSSFGTSYDNDNVQTDSSTAAGTFGSYGSGLKFTVSGETPGGISVTATNKFGMMSKSEAEENLQNELETMVKDNITGFSLSSSTGTIASDWANVKGIALFEYVLEEYAGNGVDPSELDLSSLEAEEEEVAQFFGSQLDVSDMVGTFTLTASGEITASENSSPAKLEELANDFFAYVAKEENNGNSWDNAGSDISDNMRSDLLSHMSSQLAIAGVPTETDSVVNTEYDLDKYAWEWANTSTNSLSSDVRSELGVSNDAPDYEPVIVGADVDPGNYGGSSLQYYSTKLELTGLSVDCCDFSNTTMFTEPDGFKSTTFEFSMSEKNFGLGVDATLKFDFDPDTDDEGKVVTLEPSITTDWACFDVYSGMLMGEDGDGASLDTFALKGFGVSADLGDVTVKSVTALDYDSDDDGEVEDNYLTDLDTDASYHEYDEVISFVKKDKYPLDFNLDVYTNMGDSLMPTAIDGTASYPISDQFDLGSSIALTGSGLQEMGLTFDYSF